MNHSIVLAGSIKDGIVASFGTGHGWIGTIVVGIVLGIIGKLLAPGKQKIPFWLTIICGIIGAIIGNGIAGLMGVGETPGFDWTRHILQVVAAVVVVIAVAALWAAIKKPKTNTKA